MLVCGSRTWSDPEPIRRELSVLPKGSVVIHGDAEGADMLGGQIAIGLGHEVKRYPAKWHMYGRAAGPIRNQEMLDKEHPELVLAFCHDLTKSRGTADMVRRARAAKIPVRIIP